MERGGENVNVGSNQFGSVDYSIGQAKDGNEHYNEQITRARYLLSNTCGIIVDHIEPIKPTKTKLNN